MTKEAKKSLVAALSVIAAIAAVGGGAFWRDRVEQGSALGASDPNPHALVASTDDTVVPETRFFDDILELLKRKYVDPINDEQKLADGAVRGMVASLNDPNCLFMDRDQMRVYSAVREGKYEGIGADLVLETNGRGPVKTSGPPDAALSTDAKLPMLVVGAIVPGSSAEKAGLKPGDWVEFVDDHWLPNSEAIDKFQHLQKDVQAGKASGDEYLRVRRDLRERIDKSMTPLRARDRLMMGSDGNVKVTLVRGSERKTLTIEKGQWEMPAFGLTAEGAVRVPFMKGADERLKEAIAGKDQVTIDLRNNVGGDFDVMLRCLKEVAPAGTYGYLVSQKPEKPSPLIVAPGAAKPPKLTLLVDRTTSGAAEIFALALSSKGMAKLQGAEMAGERFVIRYNPLASGAGYSLVTAEYKVNNPGAVASAQGAGR